MKMKELFKSVREWTTRAAARAGMLMEPCQPSEPDAHCWCISGAIQKCYPDYEEQTTIVAMVEDWIIKNSPCRSGMVFWNDRWATFTDIQRLCNELDI